MQVLQQLDFGDVEGHPFHGNQWTQEQTDQLKKDLGRQIRAFKEGRSRWNDIWSVADDASKHPDPEVAALGKQLKEAVWPTKPKDETLSLVQQLEFGDVEGHLFHGNQWTGGQGGGEGTTAAQAAKKIAIREDYADHLITETFRDPATSELNKKVGELIATLPANEKAWFQPATQTTQDAHAELMAKIDAQFPPGVREVTGMDGVTREYDDNKLTKEYADWALQVKAANEGYGPRPNNFTTETGNGFVSTSMAQLVNGSIDPSQYMPTPEEKLYKAEQQVGLGGLPDYQTEWVGYRLGLNDKPDQEPSEWAKMSLEKKYVDDPPLRDAPATDVLTERMTATEATLREVGSAVQDRADEILAERGTPNAADLERQLDEGRIATRVLSDQQMALNQEFGLGSSNFPVGPSSFLADRYNALTEEQKVDYNNRSSALQVQISQQTFENSDIRTNLNLANLDRREAVFAALRETRDFGPGDTGGVSLFKERDYAATVVRGSERYFPTDWIRASNERGSLDVRSTSGRGYYSDQGSTKFGGSDIRYSPRTSDFGEQDVVVMTHELGHRMEYSVPGIREAEFSQWARRTEGTEFQRMGAGYKRDEITKPDEFYDRYVGKQYGSGSNRTSREMLSMGMDSLVQHGYVGTGRNEMGITKKDPELETLVLGLLAASGRKS